MKYLKVWTDFENVLAPLNDDEVGRLFLAMLRYAATGEEPSGFSGNERFLWAVAKRDIDTMVEKSETLRQNGSKGGRPKTKENQTEPTETKENQTEANESLKDKKRNEMKGNETKRKSFTPPTVEEVDAYCKERNNGINAQHFVDYYQQGNWVLKNGRKMTDWKAAVRTWEGNGYHNNNPAPAKTVPAQQYSQRDYSDEDAEARRRMLSLVGGEMDAI